jgi:predicted transcriptional regulator
MKVQVFKAPAGLDDDLIWFSKAMLVPKSDIMRKAIANLIDYVKVNGYLPITTYLPPGGTVCYTVRLNDNTLKELKEISENLHAPMSMLIRIAILYFVEKNRDKYKPYYGKKISISFGGLSK